MRWQYLDTGFHPASYNMEFDEKLAQQLNERAIPPTLRLYGWQPFAVSIGYHQDINDFNNLKLQSEGYDLIRRPTGGKAIFHGHEVTYSVVMECETKTPREIYSFINECLLHGLRFLGIQASLSENRSNIQGQYQHPASIPCFSSTAKSEIQVNGKKLVGSAQRRIGNVILQHGSILLGRQHRTITEFLGSHVSDGKAILDHDLQSRTIEMETILDRPVKYQEVTQCIREGFEISDDIQFESHSSFSDLGTV